MKEYGGDLETMVRARLPRSLDVDAGLKRGAFVMILDGVNEVSREYVSTKLFMTDVAGFVQTYAANRFIITTRTIGYLPSLPMPVFQLESISYGRLTDLLSGSGIDLESLPRALTAALRTPLLLSMYLGMGERTAMRGIPDLFDEYFLRVQEDMRRAIGGDVRLVSLLAPLAYELVEQGVQTTSLRAVEERLKAQLPEHARSAASRIAGYFIAHGLFVLDAEGGIGFFHQSAMEFCAAKELVRQRSSSTFSLTELITFHRWDEVIVLLVTLLDPKSKRQVLTEIADRDIVFSCHAFESAMVKDRTIGLFMFERAVRLLERPRISNSEKDDIGRALVQLAPYGRKEVLFRWLDDPIIGRYAAVFLGHMGAREASPRLIQLLLKERQWPSEFAVALQLLGDASVVGNLISKGLKIPLRESCVGSNIADVAAHFESDELLRRVTELSKSASVNSRILATTILTACRSDASRPLLARMLQDSSHEVRWRALLYLRSRNRKGPYKATGVASSLFDLLSDPHDGAGAAGILLEISDGSIQERARSALDSSTNEIEQVNLAVVLSKSSPELARDLLFAKIRSYKKTFALSLRHGLAALPRSLLLPDLYKFFRTADDVVLNILIEALQWVLITEDQLPISQEDFDVIFSRWEREHVKKTCNPNFFALLAGFGDVSKPTILEKLSDPTYRFRDDLVDILARVTVGQKDLDPSAVEWLITRLGRQSDDRWNAVAQVLGRVLDQSMIEERVVPLLASTNASLRAGAYQTIKVAEQTLGIRFADSGSASQLKDKPSARRRKKSGKGFGSTHAKREGVSKIRVQGQRKGD